MKDNAVLSVSNLSKRFKVYGNPWGILKEWASFGLRSYHTDFWALKDVSFDVYKGEFVGVIGPNGAGKSTLLRVITDVLRPTSGTYQVDGRVLSILELSGGTDKDLTGRENVIRSGQLLGFPNGYVQERMQRIKEFSELGDFFEQPLRLYSSGMRARLSFSMFAFMDTDVLILDEVLAVGDIFFKQKCFARLAELIEQKTSIILVTHSMGIIQRYCDRVIFLSNGEKVFAGNPGEGIRLYLQIRGEKQAEFVKKLAQDEELDEVVVPRSGKKPQPTSKPASWPSDEAFTYKTFPALKGKGRASITRMAILNEQGEPAITFKQGERLHLYCEYQVKKDIDVPVVNMEIRDKLNLLIHSKDSLQNSAESPTSVSSGGIIHYYQSISLNLKPGNYIISIEATALSLEDYQQARKYGSGLTMRMKPLWALKPALAISILPRYGEDLELLHGGICDLPGESRIECAGC